MPKSPSTRTETAFILTLLIYDLLWTQHFLRHQLTSADVTLHQHLLAPRGQRPISGSTFYPPSSRCSSGGHRSPPPSDATSDMLSIGGSDAPTWSRWPWLSCPPSGWHSMRMPRFGYARPS
ncbi:hypothetical protein BC938DRAFT_476000 [Jimgerdemannia flammicorona]|uniref:Uncharacterized protein n=1 Tax=Jimgerdemannia flammicorona TaxID=994334 RepID=A0A433QR08_9FUNG|nr:hypothetical protein BC938DRAFT_476000 [Jimgerdemannia flammicorona]